MVTQVLASITVILLVSVVAYKELLCILLREKKKKK